MIYEASRFWNSCFGMSELLTKLRSLVNNSLIELLAKQAQGYILSSGDSARVMNERGYPLILQEWGPGVPIETLKVLGESVDLYISLLVSVWRIICENFNPNGLILAEI